MIDNLKDEIWKFIPNFENQYMISNYGRVKSLDRYITDSLGRKRFYKGNIRPLHINPNGYYQVSISHKHKTINIYPHILVCKLFNGERPNSNYVVNHIDGNKLNNFYLNLEWITYSENNIHFYKNSNKKRTKSTGLPQKMVVVFKNEYIICSSMKEVSRKFQISNAHAWRIVDTNKTYHNSFKIYRYETIFS